MLSTVEIILLLLLLFEPPGAIKDGSLKTLSEGLDSHPGVGAALFVCVIIECRNIFVQTKNCYTIAFLLWVMMASYLGVLFYPPRYPNAHLLYATCFFAATYLVSLDLNYEKLCPNTKVWCLTVAAIALVICFATAPFLMGIAELVYIYFLLWAWRKSIYISDLNLN